MKVIWKTIQVSNLVKIYIILLFLVANAHGSIFGNDDRIDVVNVKDVDIKALSKSIPALIQKNLLKSIDDEYYVLEGRSYINNLGFCKDEKFVEKQTLAANCSAFLVADDVIGTAAHCISDSQGMGLKDYAVVFDYVADKEGNSPTKISKNNVYFFDDFIKNEFEWVTFKDYAMIKLTQKVADRKPLVMSTGSRVSVGTPLFILGFPLGLPMKYQADGVVNSVDNSTNSFRHHLDTFSVNSGSAVFNADTHEIVGIHVRGTGFNYVENKERKCNEWQVGEVSKDFGEANFIDIAL